LFIDPTRQKKEEDGPEPPDEWMNDNSLSEKRVADLSKLQYANFSSRLQDPVSLR
jgi:hypothetical protein